MPSAWSEAREAIRRRRPWDSVRPGAGGSIHVWPDVQASVPDRTAVSVFVAKRGGGSYLDITKSSREPTQISDMSLRHRYDVCDNYEP